jgi:carnitine 3-dehydrogenase
MGRRRSIDIELYELEVKQVAIIGCGLIGASWAALCANRGLAVVAYDPVADTRRALPETVERLRQQLSALQADAGGLIALTDKLADAVREAEIILECVPERLALKVEVLAEIDALAPPDAIIASNTSSLLLSEMSAGCRNQARVIILHPFNPPHLMPLVELYGPDQAIIDRADAFCRALGKVTIRLKREMPGHVANRLGAALWQEAVHLVAEGVAEVADIDAALIHGPAMRWAVHGTHLTYHLGGGAGGIHHYLEHLGPSQEKRWETLGRVKLTDALKARLVAGIEAEAGGRSIAELEAERDRFLIDLLKLRGHVV